jgi:hypothetical protein
LNFALHAVGCVLNAACCIARHIKHAACCGFTRTVARRKRDVAKFDAAREKDEAGDDDKTTKSTQKEKDKEKEKEKDEKGSEPVDTRRSGACACVRASRD